MKKGQGTETIHGSKKSNILLQCDPYFYPVRTPWVLEENRLPEAEMNSSRVPQFVFCLNKSDLSLSVTSEVAV